MTAESIDLLTKTIADAAWSKKARDIVAIDVHELLSYSDRIVLCSGINDRHVGGICDAIEEAGLAQGFGQPSVEGRSFARWILLDYGEVMVHVFHEGLRDLYELDRLWGDAPRIPLNLVQDPSSESEG